MSEISGRIVGLIRDGARRLEIDYARAEQGLSFEGQPVRGWVEWRELATFLRRLTGSMSQGEVEALGVAVAETHVVLHLAFRAFPTPRLAVRLFWAGSEAISDHLTWSVEEREEILRLGVRLHDGHEGCEPFFRILLGQLRVTPALLGLPPRGPTVLTLSDRELVVDLPMRARALDRAIEAGERAVDRVSHEFLRMARVKFGRTADVPAVESIRRSLGLTETQARIARMLAVGRDPREIADELGISLHTVRTHLRTIYARTGANSQARLVSRVLLGAGE